MLLKTLGRFTCAVANQVYPLSPVPLWCGAITIQAWGSNNGEIYIGLEGMNVSTGANMVRTLPAPGGPTGGALSSWTVIGALDRSFDLSQIFVAVATAGESMLVSYMA